MGKYETQQHSKALFINHLLKSVPGVSFVFPSSDKWSTMPSAPESCSYVYVSLWEIPLVATVAKYTTISSFPTVEKNLGQIQLFLYSSWIWFVWKSTLSIMFREAKFVLNPRILHWLNIISLTENNVTPVYTFWQFICNIAPIAGSLKSQKVLGYIDCGKPTEKGTLSMQPWWSHVTTHAAVKLSGGADVLRSPKLL